ncbi:MAG: arylesterase [Pseudomonadota bacterium]
MLPAGAAAETKTIVAFGDSLTAGYRLAQDEGFAPQLETVLNRRGLDVRVVNAGVSGETSAGGRARVGWTLDNMAVKPDLLILELGANDMLRGLNPRETLRNLNAIIEEVDARGIPILLTGMLATPNVGEANFRYFNSIYPFLADRHGTAFYPFFLRGVALRQDYLLDDFLHPNANGVKIIAQGIAPTVVEALQ